VIAVTAQDSPRACGDGDSGQHLGARFGRRGAARRHQVAAEYEAPPAPVTFPPTTFTVDGRRAETTVSGNEFSLTVYGDLGGLSRGSRHEKHAKIAVGAPEVQLWQPRHRG
jgi:hypothetical protein